MLRGYSVECPAVNLGFFTFIEVFLWTNHGLGHSFSFDLQGQLIFNLDCRVVACILKLILGTKHLDSFGICLDAREFAHTARVIRSVAASIVNKETNASARYLGVWVASIRDASAFSLTGSGIA